MTKLSNQEVIRYSRHLVLDDFGLNAQLKLKASRVLVVGAGGLGSPVLLYLAAAGVGEIGIMDGDIVELSNLQRQVLYTADDIGYPKADKASQRLRALNPHTTFVTHTTRITPANALDIIRPFDIVVDGTDNFQTRYLLNDACVMLDKPLVYGSILKYEGHVAVFNVKGNDAKYSSNYRDLFPQPPESGTVQNCEQSGVLGVLPGMIGCMQANEVIKYLTNSGELLIDKLLILDAATMQQSIFAIRNQHTRETIHELIDYDDFCGISQEKNKSLNHKQTHMKEVTVQELKALKDSGADFQLIDVREPHEFDICNLNGELIPQGDIPDNVDKISRTKQVVIHCRSGARSGNMVQWLEKNHGFTNLYNLKGGVLAWAREIDPQMATY